MEQPKRSPQEELLLLVAWLLLKQYPPGEVYDKLNLAIDAVVDRAPSEDAKSEDHEQGKLPPTPEK